MRAMRATLRNAMAEALANRAALGSSMTVMIVNDVVWVAFWVLFFGKVGELRGWDGERVLLLLAVITSAAGISLGLLANARRIGVMAVGGELDAVLTLPVPPLAYVLLRRVEPTNVGDLVFGLALFAIAGHPTPARALTFMSVVALSAVLLTSFLVLTGSMAFFAGRSEGGDLGFQAMVLLGSYPVDVFAGTAKIVLYSVVPAAFVSSVPAKLIDSFDAPEAIGLVVVTTLFAAAAWTTFTLGLRRYTSGAVWTRA
jgi:ABC-2 type transport system permease protein